MRDAKTEKIIVLGVDGMDPAMSKYMLEQGKMPNLQKFIEKGSSRKDLRLLGAMPPITPPQWTTLATGAYPGTHNITCYWRQSPENLDAIVYNFDSRNCTAEQIWNATSEAGLKTLVWHWPGSSWPPTSDNENLNVVDGTQPGSVNMGVAQLDWEKIVYASSDINEVRFAPRVEKPAGVGCIMNDIEDMIAPANDANDEMMDIWWGDGARKGDEIRVFIRDWEETELVIGVKVAYDIVNSPIKDADDKWANAPEGAKEFTVLTSGGMVRRPALILKNENGEYDRVAIYKNKKAMEPLAVVEKGKVTSGVIDEVIHKDETQVAARCYKLLDIASDGSMVQMWMSNALDIANDMLWQPKSLYKQVVDEVGYVPAVSLIGGEEPNLIRNVFIPSWDVYCQWQADCLNQLIKSNNYQAIFSHLHNVDCAGHQLWHMAKNLEPWKQIDEKEYQGFIEDMYVQTDRYFGEFLHLLDEDWTVFIVSDHGLIVGENIPPMIGEYNGFNIPVMEEFGYTVMKKDENGNFLKEVDWEHTTAVQNRSNYIYLNLKGRDKNGIVDPADKYDLEEKIINDLYNYRDPITGKRVIGIAMRNKDAVLLGLEGPQCGDIYFTIDEGFSRVHGDGLSTSEGYFHSSVSPIFVAAGKGIKEGFTTTRNIRQVDVAPSVSALLGVRFTHQCEGAPAYQIFSEEF